MARPRKITEDAIAMAEIAIGRRLPKSGVKKLLREQFGLGARSCETVLARAREAIVAATKQGRDDHRTDAYAFYVSIIRDKTAEVREKLKAQERIDKLLGLEAPTSVQISSTPDDDLRVRILSDPRLNELAESFERELAGVPGGDGQPADESALDVGASPGAAESEAGAGDAAAGGTNNRDNPTASREKPAR